MRFLPCPGFAVAEFGVVTRALLAIARDGVDDRGLAMRICRACVDGLGVDGAAISLLTASVARQTLATTDATADLLEDLQFTLNEGACMQAARTGRPVLVADLQHSSEVARWPMFAAAVIERSPARAVFALPLQWGAVNLGVLDLYRRQPGALNSEQGQDALTTAETAALMMLGLRTEPDGQGGWLDPALAHRAEIHQAAGMVSVQLDLSTAQALARMRAHAFVHNRLLIQVAHDVVARRLVFTQDME
jgi:GAF domain-containing protein/ANTAR domain-containing protein